MNLILEDKNCYLQIGHSFKKEMFFNYYGAIEGSIGTYLMGQFCKNQTIVQYINGYGGKKFYIGPDDNSSHVLKTGLKEEIDGKSRENRFFL